MIEPASAIGFLALFFSSAMIFSLVGGGIFLLTRPTWRRLGALAERRAASTALIVPPLLAAILTTVLAARAFVAPLAGFEDHCPAHLQHLHLCVYHGAAWASRGWAVAAVAGICTWIALRAAHRLRRMLHSRSALARLIRVSRPSEEGIYLVPSERPFVFAAGLRSPAIYCSSATWALLDPQERAAVFEHERAHLGQGDLWLRPLLGFLALVGAPLIASRLSSWWDRATERVCDRQAARRAGAPDAIASALVRLARAAQQEPRVEQLSFSAVDVVERVEAILRDEPDGAVAANRLGVAARALVLGSAVLLTLISDPLHHVIESLLGMH